MKSSRAQSTPQAAPVDDQSLVAVLARKAPRSKAEATFQQLIASIERRREALQLWQATMQRYRERVADEYAPLSAQLRAARRKLAEAIDARLARPESAHAPRRRQRNELEAIVRGLVAELVDEGEPDAALVALFDRYHEVSYAEQRADEEEIMAAIAARVRAASARASSHGGGDEAPDAGHHRSRGDAGGAQRDRAQTDPGAARKESKAAQATRDASQSIRDVYRKLASALHPDREPDADERARKTLLIQRVNQAYQAGDLLTLLSLQLQIAQIDAAQLGAVPAQRLAHYNRILREQLAGLDAQIDELTLPFREVAERQRRPIDPAFADQSLSDDVAAVRRWIRHIDEDVAAVRDPTRLSEFLQRFAALARGDELDADEPDEDTSRRDKGRTRSGKRKRRR
jgi:hypothetical protein